VSVLAIAKSPATFARVITNKLDGGLLARFFYLIYYYNYLRTTLLNN